MALGSEVDDAIDMFILHQFIDPFKVADVHLDEAVVGFVLDVLKVGKVTRVGQLVEVDDLIFGIFVHEQANHMAADEASTASDDDRSFRTHDICFFRTRIYRICTEFLRLVAKKSVLSVSIRVQ